MASSLSPPNHHQQKTWQDIAELVTKEHDSQKLTGLIHELVDALDEQRKPSQRLKPRPVDVKDARKSA